MVNQTRICQNCQLKFTIDPEDFEFYEKVAVPPPKVCPDCRMRERLAFRNERGMFRRTCSAPGHSETVLSLFHEESGINVYCNSYWHSDAWDPSSYGRDYDYSKTFFEQYRELMLAVPFWSRLEHGHCPGCEYANWIVDAKNAYLSYSAIRSENIIYSNFIDDSREIANSSYIEKSELLHECFHSQSSSNSRHLVHCKGCIDSAFCFDCGNCKACFMCSNLRNASYCIRNVQYSREEYLSRLDAAALGSFASENELLKEFEKLRRESIHRNAFVVNAAGCTGDQIHNCRHVRNSYYMNNCENTRYIGRGLDAKDSMDCFGAAGELMYECMATGFQNVSCRWHLLGSASSNHNLTYCLLCGNSSDLFGCVGLRSKKFHILNKPYSEKEYNDLLPKVIEHMNAVPYKAKDGTPHTFGDMFPVEFSPFDYRWSVAGEYYPFIESLLREKGYVMFSDQRAGYTATHKAADLPDNIRDVDDEILQAVIECEDVPVARFTCTRAYKVTTRELEWLKRVNAPLPRKCPNCRYASRMQIRNPMKLWSRSCQCKRSGHAHQTDACPNRFETTYSPDRTELVYCESCYQSEVA